VHHPLRNHSSFHCVATTPTTPEVAKDYVNVFHAYHEFEVSSVSLSLVKAYRQKLP